MECNVFNKELKRITALPFRSLVWEESYADAGVFQAVFSKTAKVAAAVNLGSYIGIPERDTLMVVTGVEERGKEIWVTGAEAKVLLKNRVFIGTIKGGNVEERLREAFSGVSPLGVILLGDSNELTARTDSQSSHVDLFELSQTWCEVAGYGFRLRFNHREQALFYEIYEGEEKPNVKFSAQYGNVGTITLKMSEADYKNVAIVGGAGEGDERIFITVGDVDSSGLERREMFVDARDLQKEEGMTDDEYNALLSARGTERLAEQVQRVEIDVESVSASGFGKDYNLGDKIYVILREFGLYAIMRISAVNFTFENNKKKVSLVLGTPIYRSYKK